MSSNAKAKPFALGGKIKKVAKENPHRKGSKDHKRFNALKTGQSVEQALKSGLVRRVDLNFWARREIILIG